MPIKQLFAFEKFQTDKLKVVMMENVHSFMNQQTWLPFVLNNKIKISFLKTLSLTSCGISYIPGEIFDKFIPFNLEKLDLSKNDIKVIPNSISKCQKLKYLNLRKNKKNILQV